MTFGDIEDAAEAAKTNSSTAHVLKDTCAQLVTSAADSARPLRSTPSAA